DTGGGTEGCELIQSLQPPEGAEGPNVGKAEREAITVLPADGGGIGRARIFEGYATAVPVVVALYGCRLHVTEACIRCHTYRATQPPRGDVPVLHHDAVLVVDAEAERRLTGNGGRFRGLTHIGLSTRDVPLATRANPSAHKEGAGIQLTQHWVIIHGPGDVISCILHPETRDDGRKAARSREKRNAGKIYAAVEHITLTGYQRSAESRIEEILLREFPGDDFTRRTLLVIAGTGLRFGRLCGRDFFLFGQQGVFGMVKTFGWRLRFLGEEPLDHAVFHFIGIGQNIALVEAQDLAEVVDARLVAIDNLRFDGVLYRVAKEFA